MSAKLAKYALLLVFILAGFWAAGRFLTPTEITHFFAGKDARIRKIGRFFAGNDGQPQSYAPGAYIEFSFSGSSCEVLLEDEQRFGRNHNFIVYQIDQQAPVRIELSRKYNSLKILGSSDNKKHFVRICKATEAAIGYIRLVGLRCEMLHQIKAPKVLLEFIGDSITCGNGADDSKVPFGKGSWYAYHNAYESYGPLLCRELGADWQLSSVSGIGLKSSCCGLRYQMPEVYGFVGFNACKEPWPIAQHRKPKLVFITLGQNDKLRAATNYEASYIKFLQQLRAHYPKATLICCNSPMATLTDKAIQNQSIQRVISKFRQLSGGNIHFFAYNGVYRSGNDKHPTLIEHRRMKDELFGFVKTLLPH